ncbi:MFS transporter [Achromobacter agilis]|uniref:Enterobactin exporter EntS n=1 Tax=Achromobacter agilis TaxID=1353888 RepID=A0A446C5F1_9BURK|nr:MFS transporter [Achromobacter agilis]SSW63050.1 Enterobactin exporter EntS [Achromobacter agilis]
MNQAATARPRDEKGPSPFASRNFTVLWVATVLSNIGTWMHDVGAGWLMTSMSPSPMMVAMVQTATSLPVFLLSLPAGALADIVDRRRLLLLVQVGLCVVAAALAWLVWAGLATPVALLLFTLAMGTGTALIAPAWQAIVPSLVPRESLQQAIAINSVGVNISRAIGPALAGFLITAVGLALPFAVNAVSFLIVAAALLWWKPPSDRNRSLPPEQLWGAMAAGLRYARNSSALKATLVRAVAFFVFASAFWALLPLVVRTVLQGGAELYGIMLGSVGLGAVLGAFLLPRIRKACGADRVVMLGTCGIAVTLAVVALVPVPAAAIAASLLAGASWIAVLSSLNVSAQTALPDWVRARGLSIFVTVFFGSMSLGSLLWGQAASLFGIPQAMLAAAVCALLAIPLTWRWKLQLGAQLDLAPSMHWPAPVLSADVRHDRGPVMITVEYRVAEASREAFLEAMDKVGEQRRRDGAYAWGIFEHTGEPAHYIEYFLVASWVEHLRQHDRVTVSDQDQQVSVRRFHQGDAPPVVRHYLAPDRASKG